LKKWDLEAGEEEWALLGAHRLIMHDPVDEASHSETKGDDGLSAKDGESHLPTKFAVLGDLPKSGILQRLCQGLSRTQHNTDCCLSVWVPVIMPVETLSRSRVTTWSLGLE